MGNYNINLNRSPQEILREWNIDYVDKKDELLTKCVFSDCDKEAKKMHLYINAKDGRYQCKKCGSSGNLITLGKFLGKDIATLYQKAQVRIKIKKEKQRSEQTAEQSSNKDFNKLAKKWHSELSLEHKTYLNNRGISDSVIDSTLLGEAFIDGFKWITIPIFDEYRDVIQFKLRRVPADENRNDVKYRYYPTGASHAALYGVENLKDADPDRLVISEGELDALVMRGLGFVSVSSTGGCRTFLPEWVKKHLSKFKNIFIFFDGDKAGQNARKEAAHVIYSRLSSEE